MKYRKCSHPDDEIDYLEPESAAFTALRTVISVPSLLRALSQMTEFRHIGEFECFIARSDNISVRKVCLLFTSLSYPLIKFLAWLVRV